MAYIGNQNYQAYVTLNNQTFTTSGSTTIYALNYTVTNANNLDLYIGGSKQQPGVAYTASGNTLTLTTATSSSMYAVYLGQGIQTTNLPVGVVTTSNLVSGFNLPATQGGTGVTTYSTGSLLYASNSTTLTTLAPGTSGYALTLNGTTPTWASVGGSNTPSFLVTTTTAISVGGNAVTKIIWNTKTFDTNNAFDATTNYRFTVPSGQAGKYVFFVSNGINSSISGRTSQIRVYLNGSDSYATYNVTTWGTAEVMVMNSFLFNLSVGDYLETYIYSDNNAGLSTLTNASSYACYWYGFKLL